jgi:precorrin-2/cobalt-factor-2 C20-methyltransferase
MKEAMNSKGIGTFYGLGLGPGDPELITLKALRVIQEVNVIAVPSSEDGSVARTILDGVLKSIEAMALGGGEV